MNEANNTEFSFEKHREDDIRSGDQNSSIHTGRWLYLDDLRTPLHENYDVVRSYEQFKEYIESNGIPDIISFDHDLGEEHMQHYHAFDGRLTDEDYEGFEMKTGYDCCKFLTDYCDVHNIRFGKIFIHSHNRMGAQNMRTYLINWLKSKGIMNVFDWNVWFHEPEYKIVDI